MKKITVRLDIADCDALQARQIETEAKKELYMAALASSFDIPKEKIDNLLQSYINTFAEYNILKDMIQNKYMPEPNADSWNVTFTEKQIDFFYKED